MLAGCCLWVSLTVSPCIKPSLVFRPLGVCGAGLKYACVIREWVHMSAKYGCRRERREGKLKIEQNIKSVRAHPHTPAHAHEHAHTRTHTQPHVHVHEHEHVHVLARACVPACARACLRACGCETTYQAAGWFDVFFLNSSTQP